MKGIFSFHPVRVEFFDDIVQPLVAGRKVNPETYLHAALRLRTYTSRTRRYQWAIEDILVVSEPPKPEKGAGILKNLRTQLERLDHREDALTQRIKKAVDPDLHLHGRPFFVTEGSAHRVAERVDEYFTAHNTDAVDTLAIDFNSSSSAKSDGIVRDCTITVNGTVASVEDLIDEGGYRFSNVFAANKIGRAVPIPLTSTT